MNKEVKKIKMVREEVSSYIDGKLWFRKVNEQYNPGDCDNSIFLEDIKNNIDYCKTIAKRVLSCNDKEISYINEHNWYQVVKHEIFYKEEGEE